MHLSRSMKDELRAASQREEKVNTLRTQETLEHTATDSSRTESPGATGMNFNVSRNTGEGRLKQQTAGKELTERKNLLEQEAMKNSSVMTVVPGEAEEELLQIELRLACIRLEKEQIMDDEDDYLKEEPASEEISVPAQKWMETSSLTEVKDEISGQLMEDSQGPAVTNEHPAETTAQAHITAGARKQALESHTTSAARQSLQAHHQVDQELPCYDGNSSECLDFRVVSDDTSKACSPTQNMTRLKEL
ncbi:jg2401 [Pararge aegeria aegeria]|uniref:Jg2401 protein n=1 Tax=Pararge aegeria aegeria TaxID=348720 RepID=A0A8S4QHK6_9NEOP|nr:jg2401 [Pararge aegeria aegeria]